MGNAHEDHKGSDDMKNKRMRMARMEYDLSQAQLAKAVGVTRQTISLIESGGSNPSLHLCLAICLTLGKTLDDLFWEPKGTNEHKKENG